MQEVNKRNNCKLIFKIQAKKKKKGNNVDLNP